MAKQFGVEQDDGGMQNQNRPSGLFREGNDGLHVTHFRVVRTAAPISSGLGHVRMLATEIICNTVLWMSTLNNTYLC